MIKYLLLFCVGLAAGVLPAQSNEITFTVRTNHDSIGLNDYLRVTFEFENVQIRNFQGPLIEGMTLVSGPNTSFSTSIMNGQMSSKSSFEYLYRPNATGVYQIPAVDYEAASGRFQSEPRYVYVLADYQAPQEFQQRNDMFGGDFFNYDPFGQDFFRTSPFQTPPRLLTPPPPPPRRTEPSAQPKYKGKVYKM